MRLGAGVFCCGHVAEATFRILSDIHYGDRASIVTSLDQLGPLANGVETLVSNGDTTDNRPGPDPEELAAHAAALAGFIAGAPAEVRLLSGNHDPTLSEVHHLDLPGGVLVTHGDLLFEEIVPWSEVADQARELVEASRRAPGRTCRLEDLLAAHREAAARIPRHVDPTLHGSRTAVGLVRDALQFAPKALRILRAWRDAPRLGSGLLATHRPTARFLVIGHTHRAGVWRRADGRVVINTGSLCPPSGRLLVDLDSDELRVRRIDRRGGDFHPGKVVARFALTPAPDPAKPSP